MLIWHAVSELLSLILVKKEIYDTWKPGNGSEITEIWDVAFGDGKIYAATGMGVFSADLSNQGLSYFGNWSHDNISPRS